MASFSVIAQIEPLLSKWVIKRAVHDYVTAAAVYTFPTGGSKALHCLALSK